MGIVFGCAGFLFVVSKDLTNTRSPVRMLATTRQNRRFYTAYQRRKIRTP